MNTHRITTLCSKLKDWTDDPIPGQRLVYDRACSARIPAHQVNGIWHYRDDDRDAILRGLGLRPRGAELRHEPRPATEQAAA